jgi:hypothetical protein
LQNNRKAKPLKASGEADVQAVEKPPSVKLKAKFSAENALK